MFFLAYPETDFDLCFFLSLCEIRGCTHHRCLIGDEVCLNIISSNDQ